MLPASVATTVLKLPEPIPGFLNNETNSSAADMFHTQVFMLRAEP
jgi:hypothetical protein